MDDIYLPIPEELIEALARRVAEIVLAEMQSESRPAQSQWLRTKDAAEHLGWTRSSLYSRVKSHAIPHYKVDGMLLFKRDELDRWLEGHRVETGPGEDHSEPRLRRSPPRRQSSRTGTDRTSDTRPGEAEQKPAPKKRQRPLPPPLGGTEEQKDRWARDLEITRAQLDEMSPPEFDKAWKARNERMEVAGVFEHLDELEEKYGQEMWSMLPSELIRAARELQGQPDS